MTNTVALIDYGAGNVRSMSNALAEAGRRVGAVVDVKLTADPAQVAAADRIVLPGVGAFGACAAGVDAVAGLYPALEEAVFERKRPFLGVCVGMQLMADVGLEHGEHAGFGWIDGDVDRIDPEDDALKIPHMGWNAVRPHNGAARHPVFGALGAGTHVYFVHSYVFETEYEADVALTAHYGGPFTAAVMRDNMIGVQFHPEKSQAAGLAFLGAFLQWDGRP